jgi:hypothetical protein
MRRSVLLAASCAAAIAGVSVGIAVASGGGGSASRSADGPLGHLSGQGSASECMTVNTATEPATFGIVTLRVRATDQPVVLDSIRLIAARHIRLVGALVVRHRRGGIGAIAGYPPSSADLGGLTSYDWSGRQQLRGARLWATPTGVSYDVLVGVALTGTQTTRGSFRWSVLNYHQGGHQFSFATVAGAKVSVKHAWC